MAITTLDGIIAGMQPLQTFLKVGGTMEAAGVMHSLFYTTGLPGAAAAPSPGINGAALTTYAGQIPFANPVSGNTYLTSYSGAATVIGTLLLVDRLWHNSGVAVATTTAQAITSPTWPARDNNGATSGAGVLVGIEASGATTNVGAVSNTTLNYTNSAGTDTRTGTLTWPATAAAGTFVPFALAAGDVGVRSIQGVTLGTSYGGGAIHLVAYRVIARGSVIVAGGGFAQDAYALGMPRIYDDSVMSLLWLPSATTAATIQGSIGWSQG